MFDLRCHENGIEHRLTKIKHPSTDGQVERMNRTIKEATVKRYHYDSPGQLTAQLNGFIDAYNYGRRLKTLKGLTPFEYICKNMDNRARQIYPPTSPSNVGTKKLADEPHRLRPPPGRWAGKPILRGSGSRAFGIRHLADRTGCVSFV